MKPILKKWKNIMSILTISGRKGHGKDTVGKNFNFNFNF